LLKANTSILTSDFRLLISDIWNKVSIMLKYFFVFFA
jgi:hypothetical protein